MTEDEAFIRAVVDNPGDDTPRLAYADWLDDRDDPRGAYLRAEHEWAATHDPGDRETLRQMARGLDPVWVARVSRPPIGMCFGTSLFHRLGSVPATDEEIDSLAEEFGVVFPPEYRAFLLNYNGGFFLPRGQEYVPEADDAFGDVEGVAEFARYVFANYDEAIRRCGLFPIGGTAGASGLDIFIGVGQTNAELNKLFGGVYDTGEEQLVGTEDGESDQSEVPARKIADSLGERFAELEKEAIYRMERDRA